MSRAEKVFADLMGGQRDADFSFDQLCALLITLGYFMRRAKGHHVIFQREASSLYLQSTTGGRAKAYQVREVRRELQSLNLKP
jgi:hypothetical protein